jgi:hypothetical protein
MVERPPATSSASPVPSTVTTLITAPAKSMPHKAMVFVPSAKSFFQVLFESLFE